MARIFLENLEFYAYHGCFSEEQIVGTHFVVDLDFEVDTQRAEVSDNIEDTVSYLDVYQCVLTEMRQPSHLLEHVARRIIDRLRQQFPAILHVQVSLRKLNPPLGGKVGCSGVRLQS